MSHQATAPTAPTMFSKPNAKPACVQCRATERWLEKRELSLPVVDMESDAAALEFALSLGYQQAPVMWIDADNHWSGFQPDLLAKHFPKEQAA